MYVDHDAFQVEEKKVTMELKNLSPAYAEVQTQAREDREVLHQVRHIATSKPFLLHYVFGRKGFVNLTQLWRSAEAFMDPVTSMADVGRYFSMQAGHDTDRVFWQQF